MQKKSYRKRPDTRAKVLPATLPPVLVVENGSDFVARRDTIHSLGLSLSNSPPLSPSRKSEVERAFAVLNSAFRYELGGFDK